MADMIQIRRDTAANWTSVNPVLAQGELGIETDTLKIKAGNGTTVWNSLGYLIDTGGYGTVTSVGLVGGSTGLTTTGGPITTSGNITLTGTLAVANGGTALTALGTAGQVLSVNAGATALEYTSDAGGSVTSVGVSGGTTGLTTSGGPITGSGTITFAGTLAVANGGTGATTLTANNVVLGNGTSAVQVVAPGTSGNLLTSDGTTWASSTPAASGISAGLSIALAMVMGF